MANSRFYQFLYSKQAMLTLIEGKIVIGASGAVSSFVGSGVASVTQTATGQYSIQLSESYNLFLQAELSKQSPAPGTPTGVSVEIASDPNPGITSTTPVVAIQCFNSSGSLASPASGSAIGFTLLLRNSSVKSSASR